MTHGHNKMARPRPQNDTGADAHAPTKRTQNTQTGTADLPPNADAFRLLIRRYHSACPSVCHLDQATHLAVIAWLMTGGDEAAAVNEIVAAFRGLDRAGAVPLAPGRSYNETITMFWIAVAKCRLPEATGDSARVAAVRAFGRAFAGRAGLVYEYYSRSHVHSWEARSGWVEPDRRPLSDLCERPDGCGL